MKQLKRNIKILIAVLALLALFAGGYFFLLKWEPEAPEETPSAPMQSTEYIIDEKTEDIDYVKFDNGKESYIIRNGETPSIEGYSSHVIDSSALSSAIYDASSIALSHKINGGLERLSDYGLDNAEKSVALVLKDSSVRKLLIGNSANFEGEYYAMLEGGSYIGTISEYIADSLTQSPDNYRRLDICSIDSTTVKGIEILKGGKKEIKVIYDEDFKPANEYQAVSYLVTYPYKNVTASLDKLDSLFKVLAPLTASSIVEENAKDLAKYGLDKPYTLILTDDSKKTTTVKMGSYGEDGKVYIMCNNLPVVYLADCPFYENVKETNADDYVERFINLFNIENVKTIDVKQGDKKHTLEIEKKSEDKSAYKLNGKLINEDRFKNIYQGIIGVTATEFTTDTPDKKIYCKLTFNFTDGSSKTFDYHEYDDRRLIVKADNNMTCLTLTKNIEAFISKLE